jgi:outer membrane protein
MKSRSLLALAGLGLFAPGAMASPLSLTALTQRAIANSPAVRSAQASQAAEAAQVQDARAAFLPQLSVSANAIQLEGSQVAMFGVPGGGTGGSFGGVTGMAFAKPGEPMILGSATLTQPLFAGFRNVHVLQASQRTADAATLERERAERKAAFEALDALGAWQQQRASLHAAEALVKKAETRLAWVDARASAGSAGKLDLMQTRLQLKRLESQLTDARRALALAHESLSETLGGDASGLEDLAIEWALPSLTQDEAIAIARHERLDLRAQALQAEASAFQARAAHAGYLPTVSLFGTASQLGDNSANRGTVVGLQAMWVPFDGLKTPAGLDRSAALEAKRRADVMALERMVVQEVRQAYADWESAVTRRSLRAQELALAEEASRLARSTRAEGALTLADFTDAEMERLQARFEDDASRLALRRSELKLVMALGWSPERLIRQEK